MTKKIEKTEEVTETKQPETNEKPKLQATEVQAIMDAVNRIPEMENRMDDICARIDRIVEAISKSKKVAGL